MFLWAYRCAETNFEVKPLPKARIPIIKLTLQPSPGLPYGKLAGSIRLRPRVLIFMTLGFGVNRDRL